MTGVAMTMQVARRALAAALVCAAGAACAAPAPETIEAFVAAQAAGAPGRVRAHVDATALGALPACTDLQPFLPAGVAAWGRLSVGVRCTAPQAWTRFLAARVEVEGPYLVAARAIAAGAPLAADDVERRTGDLAQLPRQVYADAAQTAGMVAAHAIAPGTPLRSELLRGGLVVQQGQPVRAVAAGAGFVATIEAQALAGAAAGRLVQVKTADGRVLTGTARADGSVAVGN